MPSTASCPRPTTPVDSNADWRRIVAPFQTPSFWRSSWQLTNSVGGYLVVWSLIYFTLPISWWLTIPLMILGAGLLVRIFIIFHDCGHGCFFRTRLANDLWGFITGILLAMPYHDWRWRHALHHSNSANLDRRGDGDVWTMTVEEYRQAPRRTRIAYRLSRNPLLLFVLGPLFYFLIRQRFFTRNANQRERMSVWWMNLAFLLYAVGMSHIFGLKHFALVQLGMMALSGSAGVWLFYVQHQFEGVYWARSEKWSWLEAALQGSSFYKLPRVLQWFSGNIGYHHVHHLSSRIPNYYLEACHNADPLFQAVPEVSILQSFKSLRFRLWDEANQRLVGFGHLRKC